MLLSHDELFIHTVQDLRSKIISDTTYSIIRGCGLCRHLILDAQPLLHQVNRKYKLPIIFHIKDYTNTPLSNNFVGSGGRTILPIGVSKLVKLPEFLNTKIHWSGNNEFTVRDILDAACHYYGGIHSGNPDTKKEQLAKLNHHFNKETNISFWHMDAICKVVLETIKPLEVLISKNPLLGGT